MCIVLAHGRTGNSSANQIQKVAGEAQGDEADLQKFLKDINEGPKRAHVVKVEKSIIEAEEGESSFDTTT